MARGKHTQAAAIKREIAEQQAIEADLNQRIATLEAALAKEKAARVSDREAWRITKKGLEADIQSASSPSLRTTERALAEATAKVRELESQVAQNQRDRDMILRRIERHDIEHHGGQVLFDSQNGASGNWSGLVVIHHDQLQHLTDEYGIRFPKREK